LLKCTSADILINTVDGFQGQEREVIIFNCVRSNNYKIIGFLKDLRRLNVAITRPKHFLFVVGNSTTLAGDRLWDSMVKSCKAAEGGYFCYTQPISNHKQITDDLNREYEKRIGMIS